MLQLRHFSRAADCRQESRQSSRRKVGHSRIQGSSLTLLCLTLLCLTLGWLASGCVDANSPEPWPLLDAERFTCKVQPILAKECSAPACHGNPKRRMQVLAPGRMRLIGELLKASAAQSEADRDAGHHPPLTKVELDFNLVQARGMVLGAETWTESALLAFPLAVSAGGIYHAPQGDVFASRQDPSYVILAQWAAGLKGCQ